jgi:hypothetical protein
VLIGKVISSCYFGEPMQHSQYGVQATGQTTKEMWLNSWEGQEIFSLSKAPRMALGSTQPPIQWVQGILSPGIKWLGQNE